MGCDAAENYVIRDSQQMKWLDCNMGDVARIVSFHIFLKGARLSNQIPDNVLGLKTLKLKCASSIVKIIWKPLSLKMSNT